MVFGESKISGLLMCLFLGVRYVLFLFAEPSFAKESEKQQNYIPDVCEDQTVYGPVVLNDYSKFVGEKSEELSAKAIFNDREHGLVVNFQKGHVKIVLKHKDDMHVFNGYLISRGVHRKCKNTIVKGFFFEFRDMDHLMIKSLLKEMKKQGSPFSWHLSCAQAACKVLEAANVLKSDSQQSSQSLTVSSLFDRMMRCYVQDSLEEHGTVHFGKTTPVNIENRQRTSQLKDFVWGSVAAVPTVLLTLGILSSNKGFGADAAVAGSYLATFFFVATIWGKSPEKTPKPKQITD